MKFHTSLRHYHASGKKLLGCFACCFVSLASFAQNDTVKPEPLKAMEDLRRDAMVSSTHVITENGVKVPVDSIVKTLNRFYMDQFRHFQDPRAPYFMFMSKDGKLAMGMGGLIRMRGYFDWNGSIPASGFAPYLIPIPKSPESMRKLWATPAGTGLFFTILGNNTIVGDFMGYIQADFSGYDNRGFKLKKAYLQNDHWTVGYATTTFEDPAAEPPTIDGAGPNGINSRTNVLLRYTTTFKDKWTVAGSFEFPNSSIAADGENTKACSDFVPDIAAFFQYGWNGGASHLRLSALGRVLTYRNLIESKNHSIFGWGVQLSSMVRVTHSLKLFGIASIGQGHSSYTTDLACDSFDLVAKPGEKGTLYAPTAVGYVFGAQYYFTPKLFSNIALSEQRYYPKGNPGDSQYKYGLYGAFNLFWDITPRFEVGAEYLAGKRMNFNGTHANANRLTAMFMFSF
jgi:hypothetical protein